MSQNSPWGGPFPSLHLWPLQDTFAMKMIHLPEGQKIKIGRQTNNKTAPGERNAYFDSKVLSRTHAEIFESNNKIYIRDLKSSNGTFVNSDRLSPEGVESEPFELKSEDVVEFGIDIVSDDNRSIVHHKVAARVYCVFNAEDAQLSARELPVYQDARAPRRQAPAQQPQAMSSGGKVAGLSFDHVLQKLQSELAKSKETGAELQGLATVMTDIQDTLGGGMPPSHNGSAIDLIPPQYRSPSVQAALAGPHGQQAAAFVSLQDQLAQTQSTLHDHLDKIRQLEQQLKDQEQGRVRQESQLQDLMARNQEWDDDDDAASTTSTISPHHTNPLATLRSEVAGAVELSNSLSNQHNDAVAALTARIGALENGIASRVAEEVSKVEKRWETWRAKFEEGWRKDKESWEAERERLRGVVREWEEASRRAQEEEEERALNQSSGEDEVQVKPRRRRRRRPSSKALLAVRALNAVAEGTGTVTLAQPEAVASLDPLLDGPRRPQSPGSTSTLSEKESSESGRESGDTLQEATEVDRTRKKKPIQIPIFTVVVVAVVAGALYYKHKE